MALKNSKFLKYCCLFFSFLCFAFISFISFKPNSVYALSTSGQDTTTLNNTIISPYRNLNIFVRGSRNNSLRYNFIDLTSLIGASSSFNALNIGNATATIDNNYRDIIRLSSADRYYNGQLNKGGVVTTIDGIIAGDMPYSSKYYDNENSYNMTQTYNDFNNMLEINAYNTNQFKLVSASPRVLYCNSVFTNFDIEVGALSNFTYYNTLNNFPPLYMLEYQKISLDFTDKFLYPDINPNIPDMYKKGYENYLIVNDITDYASYDIFNEYFNNILDYCIYLQTDIAIEFITESEEQETFLFEKSYRNYGLMDVQNGVYTNRHTIPLNNDLNRVIELYGLMRNFCVMFNKFEINITAFCDNGTYTDYEDDFEIDIGNLFLDLPYYEQNAGVGITTNEILQSEQVAMNSFAGDIVSDKVTFFNLFSELFEFEIIKGFKLSYIALFALGIVLIIAFVRMFR